MKKNKNSKRPWKRLIAFALVVCVAVTLLPAKVRAEGSANQNKAVAAATLAEEGTDSQKSV